MANDIGKAAVAGEGQPQIDPQLDAARKAGNVWKHDGKEYAKLVVNGTASVGATMMHPVEKVRPIAIIGADFLWESDDLFIEHLNLGIRDERNVREEESKRKKKNITTQNAELFKETVQRGWLVKISEDGSKSDRVEKDRDQMLSYAPEVQSDIVDVWLGKFACERYFPDGTDDVDALFSEPDSIFFICKVGDYKNPAHVFILEFNTPTREQRSAYENDTLIPGTHTEGDTIISTYMINHRAKLRFFRKHLRRVVDGIALAPNHELDVDEAQVRSITESDADLTQFKKQFCPNWAIQLADSLSNCFDFGGK